jgi:hypothetical protein
MPYMEETDQYYWDAWREDTGATFQRDGSNYQPNYPKPKLSDAYRTLERHFKPRTLFRVTIVGKLYKGRSPITGMTFTTDLQSIRGALDISLSGKAVKHGGGGVSLEEKMQILAGLTDTPERITGIYFRALD